jgi:hypothetical protein
VTAGADETGGRRCNDGAVQPPRYVASETRSGAPPASATRCRSLRMFIGIGSFLDIVVLFVEPEHESSRVVVAASVYEVP